MSRVVLMCGIPGSGKSTYARRLEADGMVRLSFDVELWRRGHPAAPPSPDLHAALEAELRRRLLELVAAGRDVVLDFSFWSRRMRDDPPGWSPRPFMSSPTGRPPWRGSAHGGRGAPDRGRRRGLPPA